MPAKRKRTGSSRKKPRYSGRLTYPSNRGRYIRSPYGITSVSKQLRKIPFVYAQLDPFDEMVEGVKVPDANTMPSETVAVRDEISFGPVSGFVGALAVLPHISSTFVTPSTFTASDWTWAATFGSSTNSSFRASIISQFTAIRVVAHGVRISSTLAPTAATGFAHIAVYAPACHDLTTWPFPKTISQLRNLKGYRKVTIASLTQNPLTVVNKFTSQEAFTYFAAGERNGGYNASVQDGTEAMANHWGVIFIALEGQPGANSISVENILHLESLPDMLNTNSSTPAAPPQPRVMDAASRVASQTNNTHFESEQNEVRQQAAEAVQGVYNEYIRPGIEQMGADFGQRAMQGALGAVVGAAGRAMNAGIPGVNNQYRLTN